MSASLRYKKISVTVNRKEKTEEMNHSQYMSDSYSIFKGVQNNRELII